MTPPDVAVVGLGPAGRCLAHRLAAHGASVLALDPHPDRPWRPTYGGWARELPSWLPDSIIGASSPRTELVARTRHLLPGTYVVLDNAATRAALDLADVDVQDRAVSDAELATLAPIVVDCRGNTRALASPRTPVQQAHGLMLDHADATGLLDGATAVLMDWRPFDGSPDWGSLMPSFCYIVPLPDGRVLAEETCLAGRPPIPDVELTRRLHRRLTRHGIAPSTVAGAEVERVHIAMLPPARRRGAAPVHRFGAAGRQVNAITGYSVFASLAAADGVALSLLAGTGVRSGRIADGVRRAALDALLQLDGRGTVELFDAFGHLGVDAQRAVLDPTVPAGALLGALGRQWTLMSPQGRIALLLATVKGLLR